MKSCWEENQYVLCPHTAVAVWHHYHCPHSAQLNRSDMPSLNIQSYHLCSRCSWGSPLQIFYSVTDNNQLIVHWVALIKLVSSSNNLLGGMWHLRVKSTFLSLQMLHCNCFSGQVSGSSGEGSFDLWPSRGSAGFGKAADPLSGAGAVPELVRRLGGQTERDNPVCERGEEEWHDLLHLSGH